MLTVAEINARLGQAFTWAAKTLQDSGKDLEAYKAKIKEQATKKNPFFPWDTMKAGVDPETGAPIPFALTGYVFDSTITNPPKMRTSDGRPFSPQEIKFTVDSASYLNAAMIIYDAVLASAYKAGDTMLDLNNLTKYFGNKLPFSVKQRVDQAGNPTDGYWVNVVLSVQTGKTGDDEFQNCKFGSLFEDKVLDVHSADRLLKPTDSQRAYIKTTLSLYQDGNAHLCARAASLTLTPSPRQAESISVDDLFGQSTAVAAPATPAPAPQPTMAQQAPVAPAPMAVQMAQPTPAPVAQAPVQQAPVAQQPIQQAPADDFADIMPDDLSRIQI